MAKKYYKPTNTYDYTKSIDIRVNTSYITGLENILMYFFTNIIEDPRLIPATFEKFRVTAKKKSNMNRASLKWERQFNN